MIDSTNDDSALDAAYIAAKMSYAKRQQVVVTGQAQELCHCEGSDILMVPRRIAAFFAFPPGHPRENVLYIGDPLLASVYCPAAYFHRMTFERKFSEAVRLVMSLGATSFDVEYIQGWSKEFAANLTVPLDVGRLGANLGSSKKSGWRGHFGATLVGSSRPCIPDNLVWYSHEPTWQQVAEGRMKYGMRTFDLDIHYEDDFGVNASLQAKVLDLGLDLGGRFVDYQTTVWRIAGEFTETSMKSPGH